MTAEIISVGTELLLGNILNTNAQYLSRELAELGITVQRESTIGDNQGRLADFVNEAKNRCDLLVFTGGLGPTADDLTKETVAACYGDTLVFDESEWEKITGYFARSGRVTTPNNRKQAMVPVKGHKIINHHGTAPGAWFEQEGRCAVLMPGVPGEMKAMWKVMIPMASPGIITVTIFNFMNIWNEYFMALIFANGNDKIRTLSMGLQNMITSMKYTGDWAGLFAGVIIVLVPTLILYLLLSEKIVAGITGGAVKG